MRVIHLERTLPDGRVMQYHRIHEYSIAVGEPNMLALLGSWATADGAKTAGPPEAVTAICFPNNPDLHMVMLEQVILLPDWSAGQIVEV